MADANAGRLVDWLEDSRVAELGGGQSRAGEL